MSSLFNQPLAQHHLSRMGPIPLRDFPLKAIRSYSKRFPTIGGLHEDKLCDTSQAMAPTSVKTVHQIPLLPIESNLDRLRLLPPTHGERSQQQSGQITFQSVLINKPKFLRTTRHAERRKLEYRGPWWWRP